MKKMKKYLALLLTGVTVLAGTAVYLQKNCLKSKLLHRQRDLQQTLKHFILRNGWIW